MLHRAGVVHNVHGAACALGGNSSEAAGQHVGASASTEVAAELCERLLVHLLNRQAVPIGPVGEVLCRSQISARGNRGVARFRQGVCKPVEQGSRRTIPKCTNSSPTWVEVR